MEKLILNDGNIIRTDKNKELPFTKGIGEILFEKLNKNKDQPMQIDGMTANVDSHGSFLNRSIRTAIKMRAKGITPHDIITVCSSNHFDTNVPVIAGLFLGVRNASIDPFLSVSDATHLLEQIKPKMIFVSENGIELIEKVIQKIGISPEIVVFGESPKYSRFSDFLTESPEEEKTFKPTEITDLKETCSIFFSSGTTGLAKGICLNHLSILSQLPAKEEIEHSPNLLVLNYSSPYWISSMILLMYTIVTGARRLVLPKFEVDEFWRSIDKYKVDMLILSPTQLATLCSNPKPVNVDISSMKIILAGGSTIYKQQIDKMKEYFPTTIIGTGYGQTELGGGCIHFSFASNELNLLFHKPLSCGRPQPGYLYKVVDLETEEPLGPNEKGELMVKTEYCMNGYYNIDSSNAWDSDGFLKTGDIVYYDEDYCFYIVDRIKDMLKFQGWQITPAKLEAILLSHPAIATALVIGLPHPVDCDHPTGIVQLKKSAKNVTTEDIQKYYNEKIDDDKYRLRGGLKIIDNIPTTPTGKYRKRYLKELILSGSL